ncbi:Nodulation protein S (NodS) [Actinopolyspora mzabensis]|uniref:Nodulation protein S (NodS) n=1 Tax=Actinopolyspora mzabensis TaxID=995066 RepID=A0A1G9A085_ACTMZ|nr:methyltransferase domain-containing protein [Actinopolyspora mzabensis]SDK20756.1 Nodulation protein S (NodS) [Actinopolyspora mzabensis]
MSTPSSRFEQLYQGDPDPWRTASSWYEWRKRAVALACLPKPRYTSAIEPACGTGELTAALAGRCDRLAASDASRTATARARHRVADQDHVEVRRRRLPDQFPSECDSAELVVLSEILYYLAEDDAAAVLAASVRALRPAGDLLAVHWRPQAPDAPSNGDSAHQRLREHPDLDVLVRHTEPDFLVDVLRRA